MPDMHFETDSLRRSFAPPLRAAQAFRPTHSEAQEAQ